MGASPLVAAVQWLEHSLLGSVAVTVAVIAVAWIGFLAITGRIAFRRGATVVVGCFVLFGAARIAAGIRATATLAGGSSDFSGAPVAAVEGVTIPPSLPNDGADPYAGASLRRP